MKEAVIISTARTPIGRAYKGALNNTLAPTMGGWAIEHAVKKAGINPAEVDDCIMGCVLTQGTVGANIGRLAGLKGGLPVTVSG
ncbi:MAG: acetyl-CoA C-acyltransferase, partial [Saprospiraceae bacterium]